MKFTSEKNPEFSVEASPESNWDLNLFHALDAERRKFKRSVPNGVYRGEDGRSMYVEFKMHGAITRTI